MTLKKTTIPQLPVATTINNSDYYILQQGSVTKRVQHETLVNTIENRDSNVEFYNTIIDSADSTNTRNDQSSIVEISGGRLLIAYSHFQDNPGDDDISTIWGAISDDRGQTWGTPFELIGEISGFGTYIPSFYKKTTGEIVCVFFVRVQTTPTRLSALYQIVYNENLTIQSGPTEILAPDDYYPVGSDRLFYDQTNERLLMPYPKLISGSGSSTISLYEGRLLISDNEGVSWYDGGLSIGLDQTIAGGFGGATEPGIYLNPNTGEPIYYYGTLLGSYWAVQLTAEEDTYLMDDPFNTTLYAQNGFGTIVYWPERGIYLGARIRLIDNDPLNNDLNTKIDLSASVDGQNWFDIFQVEDATATGGYFVNEPIIYIDNSKDRIIIAYSVGYDNPAYYSLKSVIIPSVAINVQFSKTILNQNFDYQVAVGKILGTFEVMNNTNGNALALRRQSNTGKYAILGFKDEDDRRIAYIGLAEDGDDQHLNEVVNPPAESTATSGSKLSLVKRAHIFGQIGNGYKVGLLDGKLLIASAQHDEAYFNDTANYPSALTVEGGPRFISTTKTFHPPSMTETQRDGIAALEATGGIIFNTTSGKFQGYNGAGWVDFA